MAGRTLRVRVPDPMFREWLIKHYSAVITEALAEVHPEGSTVEFVADAPDEAQPSQSPGTRLRPIRSASRRLPAPG